MANPTIPSKKNRVPFTRLEEAFRESILECIAGKKKVAVSFSGGIDSALMAFLAKEAGADVVALGLGVKGSHDSVYAKESAKTLGIELRWKEISSTEIKKIYEQMPRILHTHDFLQCSIGTVNYAIAQFTREQKFNVILSGTGADELFCGYGEFDQARNNKELAEELRAKRMREMRKQNLNREEAIGKLFGIEQRNPYMHARIMELGLQIPAWRNLKGKYGPLRKSVLRETALRMGLPKSIAIRPKKAMQYGSGVARVLKKTLR